MRIIVPMLFTISSLIIIAYYVFSGDDYITFMTVFYSIISAILSWVLWESQCGHDKAIKLLESLENSNENCSKLLESERIKLIKIRGILDDY